MGAAFVHWFVEEAAARRCRAFKRYLKLVNDAKITKPVGHGDVRRTITEDKLIKFERESGLCNSNPPESEDLFTETQVAALLNVPFQDSEASIEGDSKINKISGYKSQCSISGENVRKLMRDVPLKPTIFNDNPSYVYKNRELLHRLYGDVAILVSQARVVDTASTLSELDERLDCLTPDDVPYLVSLAPEPIMTR